MRLVTAVSLMLLVCSAAAGAERDAERIVARQVQSIVPPDGAGGVAVALRLDGRTAFFNYGWADRAGGRRIPTETLFNLASLREGVETTLPAPRVGQR